MNDQNSVKWRHDLKNQLGIVLGFSELLLNDMDPQNAHRADIEEIHTAARRALALLGQDAERRDAPHD